MGLVNRAKYLEYQRQYARDNKEKKVVMARAWVLANPERVLENKRRYNKRNADKIRKRNAELRLITPRNMERERLLARERYSKNKEKIRVTNRIQYIKNSEKRKAYAKKWRTENKAHYLMLKHTRRQREKNVVGRFNNEQLEARFEYYGFRCAYCRQSSERLEIDHVIPLSKGGTHWPSNLRPACRTCNASKSDHALAPWIEFRDRMEEK